MVVGRCGGSGGDEDGGGFCVGSGNVVRGACVNVGHCSFNVEVAVVIVNMVMLVLLAVVVLLVMIMLEVVANVVMLVMVVIFVAVR